MISLDVISYLFDFLFDGDHLLATLFLIHSAYMIMKLFVNSRIRQVLFLIQRKKNLQSFLVNC